MAPQLVQVNTRIFIQSLNTMYLKGKRNKHTGYHPDVEDRQNDTETPRVADELFDSTQVSLPMETTEEQESNPQHLPDISPALPAKTTYGGHYQKPNTQRKEATLVSAQYGSPFASQSLQKDTEPFLFPNYRAFPSSVYKTNDLCPVTFSPPIPLQYFEPNESERQTYIKGKDYSKRQRMSTTDQYQRSRYKTQYAGFKKEPSDRMNYTDDQSKQSKESKPPIKEAAYQRTSVIKRMNSLKRKSPEQLQYEAEILKYQGSILQHTGRIVY